MNGFRRPATSGAPVSAPVSAPSAFSAFSAVRCYRFSSAENTRSRNVYHSGCRTGSARGLGSRTMTLTLSPELEAGQCGRPGPSGFPVLTKLAKYASITAESL